MTRKLLPSTTYNFISMIGVVLALFALAAIVILFFLERFAEEGNPYLGIFTFMVLPAILVVGLVHVGAPDLNPTWMDAQTSAGPVTPRHGFPVEIEALWYALLAFLAEQSDETFVAEAMRSMVRYLGLDEAEAT